VKVSIKQISEETGFSPATVSNALNRRKGVNGETAEKILKAAERLGYQSDKAITSIRFVTYRKNGLIIDDCQVFPAMIEGVEQQAKELGYETTFSRLDHKDEDFEERLNEVVDDTGSILILLATEMIEEDFEPFRRYKGRMVLLDGWSEQMDFDGILINNTDAACHAVEYLIEKGHTEIGYLRGDYRIKGFQYREYGYKRAMERAGLRPDPKQIITIGTKLESAYEGMKEYLEQEPALPTAYFADNDVIALGAMRAMKEKGIRIPEDVSVVGFDDSKFGLISVPGLTTVHIYKHEMGATAVRRALDYVKNQDKAEKMKIQVCTTFVERESVRDLKRA
jgi:Transcriptional regulators